MKKSEKLAGARTETVVVELIGSFVAREDKQRLNKEMKGREDVRKRKTAGVAGSLVTTR